MKKLIYVLVILVLIVVGLFAFKDSVIQFVVEKSVQSATGLKLNVKGFHVGLIKTVIDIKELRLYNPRGFHDKVMLDMPEIYVDYDLPAFFKGQIHLPEVRIDLKEFIVEKNAKGELNLNSLAVTKEAPEEAEPAKEKKQMQLQIDTLQLKVGRVLYKDYSQGGEPTVQEFAVNIDETYDNITDLKSVVSIIVAKSLAKTTISKLANFEVDKLQQHLTDQLASKVFGGGALGSGIKEALQGLLKRE
ncbi:MAG: AsmA family protein [Candidatus Omnitrophota bacterium]